MFLYAGDHTRQVLLCYNVYEGSIKEKQMSFSQTIFLVYSPC